MPRITEIQYYYTSEEIITFYRDDEQRNFMNPSIASRIRLGQIARILQRRGWKFYPFSICPGWGLRKGEPA